MKIIRFIKPYGCLGVDEYNDDIRKNVMEEKEETLLLQENEIVGLYNLITELEKMGFSFTELCNTPAGEASTMKRKIQTFIKEKGSDWMRGKNCKPW